jgi:hypothetical protein
VASHGLFRSDFIPKHYDVFFLSVIDEGMAVVRPATLIFVHAIQ